MRYEFFKNLKFEVKIRRKKELLNLPFYIAIFHRNPNIYYKALIVENSIY
jgi:hypothetical protein